MERQAREDRVIVFGRDGGALRMRGQATHSLQLDEDPPRQVRANPQTQRLDRAVGIAGFWNIVAVAIIPEAVELKRHLVIRIDQREIAELRIELQFDRRPDRAVAGHLAVIKSPAEAGTAEKELLAWRQNVGRILPAYRSFQRRIHLPDRKEILYAGNLGALLQELGIASDPDRTGSGKTAAHSEAQRICRRAIQKPAVLIVDGATQPPDQEIAAGA